MAVALGLFAMILAANRHDAPPTPIVTRTGDTWKIVSGVHSRTYNANLTSMAPAIVDKHRRLVILPGDGFVVGLDFQGNELWKYTVHTGLDPSPFFRIGGVLIGGIGRLFQNRSLLTRRGNGADEVESEKKTPWMVGLDERTGKVLWTLDELSSGSPLIGLDERSLLCLRISNPLRFYGASEPERYELDLRDPATGRLLKVWHVSHAPPEMYIALGLPPWSPLQEDTRVSGSPAGWKIAIGLPRMGYSAKPVPPHSYLYIVVPLKNASARCRVVHQAYKP